MSLSEQPQGPTAPHNWVDLLTSPNTVALLGVLTALAGTIIGATSVTLSARWNNESDRAVKVLELTLIRKQEAYTSFMQNFNNAYNYAIDSMKTQDARFIPIDGADRDFYKLEAFLSAQTREDLRQLVDNTLRYYADLPGNTDPEYQPPKREERFNAARKTIRDRLLSELFPQGGQ